METLKKRLARKTILNLDGIDFLFVNGNAVAYFEGLKITPLDKTHIEILEKKSINVDPNVSYLIGNGAS
jgi:hypothetical protein